MATETRQKHWAIRIPTGLGCLCSEKPFAFVGDIDASPCGFYESLTSGARDCQTG